MSGSRTSAAGTTRGRKRRTRRLWRGCLGFPEVLEDRVVPSNPGALDATFGTGGIVSFAPDGDNFMGAAVNQPDGKIVFDGVGSGGYVEVVRLNDNGSLDQGFGTGGIARTLWPNGQPGYNDATAIALESNGDIVIAGYGQDQSGNQFFAAARFLPGGKIDSTFGTGGIVTLSLGGGDTTGGVAVDASGNIVLAGSASFNGSYFQTAVLIRYTPTGMLDPSFGNGGVVTTSFGFGNSFVRAVTVQADGRSVVGGESTSGTGFEGSFAIVRYTTSGALDPSFNGHGLVLDRFSELGGFSYADLHALTLGPSGTIVAAGDCGADEFSDVQFAVARYTSVGSLDTTFDRTGHAELDLGSGTQAAGVAIQSNGKLVVVGPAPYFETGGFAVARYDADGTLDAAFGTKGIVTTNFEPGSRSEDRKSVG